MAALLLDSFEARGFRGFGDLKIAHLGRVNLIVGKNNVGKTSLLEALRLYARRGEPALVWELLSTRDEGRQRTQTSRPKESDGDLASLRYLFYGRPDLKSRRRASFQLGPIGSVDRSLVVSLEWLPVPGGMEAIRTGGQLSTGVVTAQAPHLSIQWGDGVRGGLYTLDTYPPMELSRELVEPQPGIAPVNCVFVAAHGLSKAYIGELWDSVSLTDLEHFVLEALRVIAPGVERLTLVADRTAPDLRMPIVKIAGISDPMPLRSLGDGMQRAFVVALALVNARDGMLLVDEIENGLHYLVQPEIWQLLFQTARQLNVQVFATTHSWDCIRAFQRVAAEDQATEGVLIRLDLKPSGITSTTFDETELAIATRDQIEVR